MRPSSAQRSFGIKPPYGMPCLIAKSRAARSTPVWPPDIILLGEKLINAIEYFLLNCCVRFADLLYEACSIDSPDLVENYRAFAAEQVDRDASRLAVRRRRDRSDNDAGPITVHLCG